MNFIELFSHYNLSLQIYPT